MLCHGQRDNLRWFDGPANQVTLRAIEAMRRLQRPSFLHLAYYRYLEHVGVNEDFNAGYRDRSEYEKWRNVDPVALQRRKLGKWFSEEEIKAVEKAINEQVERSIKRADDAPFSRAEELYEDVLEANPKAGGSVPALRESYSRLASVARELRRPEVAEECEKRLRQLR